VFLSNASKRWNKKKSYCFTSTYSIGETVDGRVQLDGYGDYPSLVQCSFSSHDLTWFFYSQFNKISRAYGGFTVISSISLSLLFASPLFLSYVTLDKKRGLDSVLLLPPQQKARRFHKFEQVVPTSVDLKSSGIGHRLART
jgi:hypothetical protein